MCFCLNSKHAKLEQKNQELQTHNDELVAQIFEQREKIEDLEAPIEKLKPAGTIDIHEASSILLNLLGEMKDTDYDIFLPDNNIKVYRKEDVQNSHELEEVSQIPYEPDNPESKKRGDDCDGIAAALFGKFAGLVWTNVHALNWFIEYETNIPWFIEPQTKKIARNLENWQGWDIRFFLGR